MKNTARSFLVVTGFSIATRLASFIFKMWMSRSLGAEIVGLYQIALSVLLMLFTITAGAPTVLSRKVAEAGVNGDIKKQNALLSASAVMGLGVSAVICAVLYALGDRLSFLFSNPQCLPLFFIMLPTLVTSTLYASLRSWFWGRKNFIAFSSTELVDEIVKIVLSIVFAGGFVGTISGARGIALAMTISDAFCVLVLAILFFIAGGRIAKPKGFKQLTLGIVPLSATRIITSLGASLTALVIPQMLVKGGLSVAEATAEYGRVAGMALPLIMAPVTFISALSIVLIPDVASLRSKNDLGALRAKLSSCVTFGIVIASFFFAVYLPLGTSLGKILFGDEKAGNFVSYCSMMLFPIAIAQSTTPMLNSLGKEKNTLLHTFLGALAMLPCIIFMPRYIGVYAMALGSGVCFLVISIANFIVLKKEVGSFANLKKDCTLISLSIPLAVGSTFLARLLRIYANHFTAIVVVGIYVVFLFFVTANAFDVIDLVGCVKMLLPSKTIKTQSRRKSAKKDKALKKKKAKKPPTVSSDTKKHNEKSIKTRKSDGLQANSSAKTRKRRHIKAKAQNNSA